MAIMGFMFIVGLLTITAAEKDGRNQHECSGDDVELLQHKPQSLTESGKQNQSLQQPVCTESGLEPKVDILVEGLVKDFNKAWPKMVVDAGLDPWNDVWVGKITIPCKYFGTYYCPLYFGSCISSWIKINDLKLQGLSNLLIQTPLESVTVDTGSCSTGSQSAVCSFRSSLPVTAILPASTALVGIVEDTKFKVKCIDFFGHVFEKTPLVLDKVKCSATNAKAHADVSFCTGDCGSGLSIYSAKVKNLKIDSSTKFKCDTDFPNLTDELINLIVNALEEELYKVVQPVIQDLAQSEINKLIGDGYPNPC